MFKGFSKSDGLVANHPVFYISSENALFSGILKGTATNLVYN
jgi:hypothetical protein